MLFARAKDEPTVVAGATFERNLAPWLVERAHVREVSTDATGIPHVRFSVELDLPSGTTYDESERTLALASFRATFARPVPA